MENNINEVSSFETVTPLNGENVPVEMSAENQVPEQVNLKTNPEKENVSVSSEHPIEARAENAPSVIAHGDNHDEDSPLIPEEEEKSHDAGGQLFEELLGSGEQFEDALESANIQELVFLMDRFGEAEPDQVFSLIPKFHILRKAFDKALKEIGKESGEKFESKFLTAQAKFNHKRSAAEAVIEKEKEKNSVLKGDLLERLKGIVEKENVQAIADVRQIQKEWKETGWVKQEDREPFNKRYMHYIDLFYGLRAKYNELIDIDRKHNLDEKQDMIQKLGALIPSDNTLNSESWRAVSELVKEFQDLWKSVGPVPKENFEEINEAWKKLLENFYAKRQEYYELQDEERKVNSDRKTELLEKMRSFLSFESNNGKEWNKTTETLLALQNDWKDIGPGTSEANKNLWKEYREIYNAFFKNKSGFFDKRREEENRNLNLKLALVEQAETLSEATDWRETSRLLKNLQEDWKNIGAVPDRQSQKLWFRFRKACDTFFQAREAHNKAVGADYQTNLDTKNSLIQQLKDLAASALGTQEKSDAFDKIQDAWKATGHVPFEKKDELNKAFRDSVRLLNLRNESSSNGTGNYSSNGSRPYHYNKSEGLSVEDRGNAELKKLLERVDFAQRKINTLENNILMVAKGRSGDGLRTLIQSQIEDEKSKLEQLKASLKETRASMEKETVAVSEPAENAEAEPKPEA